MGADDGAPEGDGGQVFGDLGHLPDTGKALEGETCGAGADATAGQRAEHVELPHVPVEGLRDGAVVDQAEAGNLAIGFDQEGMIARVPVEGPVAGIEKPVAGQVPIEGGRHGARDVIDVEARKCGHQRHVAARCRNQRDVACRGCFRFRHGSNSFREVRARQDHTDISVN